jgi:HSP20 family protein
MANQIQPRRDLFSGFFDLHNEVNKLFQDFLPSAHAQGQVEQNHWLPAFDIVEEKERYLLKGDLPGVNLKDVDIRLDNQVLTIKGHKATETKEEKQGYCRFERQTGSFYRQFQLPADANGQEISAAGENGVLTIVIPKAASGNHSHKIQIQH